MLPLLIAVLMLSLVLAWLAVGVVRRRRPRVIPFDVSPSDTLVQLESAVLVLGAAQRPGQRHTQADAFGFYRRPRTSTGTTERAAVAAVIAEGTGDLEQGAETSSTAAHVFLQALTMDVQSGAPVLAAMERALRAANAAVLQVARDRGVVDRVGSTLAAVVITADGLHWIAAGNSRIYLWRRGELHEVNVDRRRLATLHAAAPRPTAAAAAPPVDARSDDGGALGNQRLPSVDFSRRPLRLDHGDRLVLCGAGVYDVLSAQEIAQHVGVDGTAPADELVEAAVRRRRPATGNVTGLVLTYDERDPSAGVAMRTRAGLPPRSTKLEHV